MVSGVASCSCVPRPGVQPSSFGNVAIRVASTPFDKRPASDLVSLSHIVTATLETSVTISMLHHSLQTLIITNRDFLEKTRSSLYSSFLKIAQNNSDFYWIKVCFNFDNVIL